MHKGYLSLVETLRLVNCLNASTLVSVVAAMQCIACLPHYISTSVINEDDYEVKEILRTPLL
jgi:hypothetical protein